MNRIAMLSSVGLCMILLAGCQAPGPKHGAPSASMTFTADDNPTTSAGRGAPSLDDIHAPAVWVFLDGHAGQFLNTDNDPITPWMIEAGISSEPNFRVEVFEPLLGKPTDFSCVLSLVDNQDGDRVGYAIKAKEGTFVVGRTYSLLRPGKNFVVRNLRTGDVVDEIALLPSGMYMLAAGLKNAKASKEGLSITHFRVP